MPSPVCNTAMMTCSFGVAPGTLIVTSQQTVMIENQLAATIMDFAPMSNIGTFSMCTTPSNPAVAAAQGAPSACVPVTVAPWTPGAVTVTNNNFPLLNSTSTCTCAYGGVITISNPVPIQATTA
jgi:hypothetical protein